LPKQRKNLELASQIVLQKIGKFLILARVTTNHLEIAFSPQPLKLFD
jgi:hypothetical protein